MLELAAGPGDTGFDVAELLGARGRLISSDLSPAMLDVARRRGRERGIDNVDHRIVDAERIALPDDAVDAVVCRFGYMIMDDPAAALAETRRVLRPGGRLALASSAHPTATRSSGRRCARRGRPPAAPGPVGTRSVQHGERGADPAAAHGRRLRRRPRGAGRGDVHRPGRREYVAIHTDTSGPMALALAALDAGARRALTERLRPALAPFRTAAGCALPGVVVRRRRKLSASFGAGPRCAGSMRRTLLLTPALVHRFPPPPRAETVTETYHVPSVDGAQVSVEVTRDPRSRRR